MTGTRRTGRGLFRALLPLIVLAAGCTPPAADPPPAAPPAPAPEGGYSVVLDGSDLLVQRRRFEAGTRTYWHAHEEGFLLLVESGRARTQRAGEPMRELDAGETDYTPPGVMHWHGAAPEEDLVQIGVLFGGGIAFTDPVTDDEYHGR